MAAEALAKAAGAKIQSITRKRSNGFFYGNERSNLTLIMVH
jgi:hypothetical protein